MPGETLFTAKDLGQCIAGEEFHCLAASGMTKPIMQLTNRAKGLEHYVFVIDGVGIGIGSATTHKVFVIPPKALVELARAGGVDEERTIIITPDGEVARGA